MRRHNRRQEDSGLCAAITADQEDSGLCAAITTDRERRKLLMKKLLFFDIDGTIISEGETRVIPNSMYKALRGLQAKGHLCFVNTGRSYAEIDQTIRNMKFDGFVCGCGTNIRYRGKELFSRTIPFSVGNAVIQDLEACRLDWLLEGCDSVYYSSKPYKTLIGTFQEEHSRLIPDAVKIVAPQQANNLIFDKFCICLHPESDFDRFYAKYSGAFSFIDRKNGFYEIMPQGFSKAGGIQFLEKYFQIPHEDTIAIGDSTNDLPMLEYAGFSIAMGNCAEELLSAADYVTKPIMEDGIYHAMKHLELI